MPAVTKYFPKKVPVLLRTRLMLINHSESSDHTYTYDLIPQKFRFKSKIATDNKTIIFTGDLTPRKNCACTGLILKTFSFNYLRSSDMFNVSLFEKDTKLEG